MFYVFDLDGTLADLTHRKHLIDGRLAPPDWRAFFARVRDDEPIWPVIHLLITLREAGHKVEVWSGRSEECREETEAWLNRHVGAGLTVLMRNEGDHRPDHEMKMAFLHMTDRPDIIFDDRDAVVAAWRARGLTCLQVAPGAF